MAYTLNRRLAELIDSNGQLNTGKIPNSYITTAHLGTTLTPTFGNTTVGSRLTFSSNSHYLETGTNAVAIKNGSGTVYLNATNTGTIVHNNLTVSGDILKTSGNLVLNVAGDIKLDADGSNVYLADAGTDIGLLSVNGQNLNIRNLISDKDIYFQGKDGTSTITALELDMSDTGRAKFLYAANIPNLASADGTIQINLNNTGIPTFPSGFTSSAAIVSTASNSNSLGGTNFTGIISVSGNTLSDTSRNVYTNNLTVAGNLDVQGSTTTLNTATLQVEDKNVVLNYHASNDTSGSADGAGITIQDAVSAGNDASLYWRASDDKFIFSHPLRMFGQFELPDNVKMIAGDNADLQIYHDGSNSYIKDAGDGDLKIESTGGHVEIKGVNSTSTSDWGNKIIMSSVQINTANRTYGGLVLKDHGTSGEHAGVGFRYDGTGYKLELGTAATTNAGITTHLTVDRLGAIVTSGHLDVGNELTVLGTTILKNSGVVTIKAAPLGNTYGGGFNAITVTGTSSSPYTSTIGFSNYGETNAMVIQGTKVGIGETSPDGKLHIKGATATGDLAHILFENTQGNKVFAIGGGSTGVTNSHLYFRNVTDNTRPMVITDAGDVGIGTAGSSSGIQLQIGNTSNNSAITRVTNGTTSVDLTASSSGKAFLEVGTAHPLILATNAQERMVIEAGGDVAVKAGKELRLYRSDNATYGSLEYMSGAGGLKLRDVNGDGMTFAGHSGNDYINIVGSNGNIGINHGLGGGAMNSKFNVFADGEAFRVDGTSNTSRTIRFRNTGTNGSSNGIIESDGTLQLKNTDANAAIYMNSIRDMEFQVTSGNGSAGHMRFYSYNTQIMHLDGANNRVGIGTDQPGEALEVDGIVEINRTGDHPALRFAEGGTTRAYFGSGDWAINGGDADDFGISGSGTGDLLLGTTAGVERLRIKNNGQVGIGCTPTNKLHVRNASSGGTATTNSVAVFEDNDNTEVSILGGSSSILALNFGHSNNNDEFSIKANTTATDRYLQFDVSTTPVAKLDIEGLHFQRADGQKISAKESIVMTVDADNNTASRVFQVNHGNGKTLLNLHDDYRMEVGTLQFSSTRSAGYSSSNGLGASAGDWVDIAAVPYGRNIATIKLFWDAIYSPSSSHHGNMEFDIGSHYGTSYYYGWDSYINLKASSAHNSFHITEARIITPNGSGATGYFQVKFGQATGTQGNLRAYVTHRDEQCSIDPITPVVNNSRSGTTIAAVNLETRPGQAVSRDFISKGSIRAEGQPGFFARGNTSQWLNGQAASWAIIRSGIAHGGSGYIGVNLTEGSTGHLNCYDTQGNFNTGNGRFTAPVAGKYHLHGSLYCAKTGSSLSDYMHFNLFLNGSNVNQTYTMGGHQEDNQHDFDLKQSTILYLEEGDFVEWRLYSTTTNMRIYGDHVSLGAALIS